MSNAIWKLLPTIIVISVVVAWGATLVLSYALKNNVQENLPTPSITMTYQKNAPGDYNFTVASVSWNDVKWSDITYFINPIDGNSILPKTMYVAAGDIVSIQDLTPGGTYTISLGYAPTGGACYQVTLIAT